MCIYVHIYINNENTVLAITTKVDTIATEASELCWSEVVEPDLLVVVPVVDEVVEGTSTLI